MLSMTGAMISGFRVVVRSFFWELLMVVVISTVSFEFITTVVVGR
jgi:hypothetical protein